MSAIEPGELYSCEPILNRDRIDSYKSLGATGLAKLLAAEPLPVTLERYEQLTVLVLDNMCHRTRAAYELGLASVPFAVIDESDNRSLGEAPPYAKVADVPVKNGAEYFAAIAEYRRM